MSYETLAQHVRSGKHATAKTNMVLTTEFGHFDIPAGSDVILTLFLRCENSEDVGGIFDGTFTEEKYGRLLICGVHLDMASVVLID